MASKVDDDRRIDAEDSSTDDEQGEEQMDQEEPTALSLPPVTGSSKKKLKKSEKKRNKMVTVEPGIIRLSGLPHGFFERELFSYFSQFGKVTRLKLIRSKKTGASRGYAYIEFEDEDVARIASETMNGYLMFRSLIKSRLVDRQKLDTEKLFDKWKRLFRVKTPSQKRAAFNRKRSEKQIERSQKRRAIKLLKQQEKLAAAGIEYELKDFIPLKQSKSEKQKAEKTPDDLQEKVQEKPTKTQTTKKTKNK